MKRFLCVLSLILLVAVPVFTDEPVKVQALAPPHTKSVLLYEKLSSALNKVVEAPDPINRAQQAGFKVINGRVQVVVTCDDGAAADVVRFLEVMGAANVLNVRNLVRADVEPSQLSTVNDHPNVLFVRRPDYLLERPEKAASELPKLLMVSEGVQAMNADNWHAAGLTGQGIRIGVVDIGFAGYQSLIGSELPTSSSLHYQRFSNYASSQRHGTACAEIVHDVAPDAELFLAEISEPVFEGAAALDWLYSQGVDVVTASLGFFNLGPGNGSGLLADGVNAYHQAGGLMFISAGNHRRRHWQGHWSDTNGSGWQNFAPDWEINYITEDGNNPAYLSAGSSFAVALSWNQWVAPTTDLDLCVYVDDPQGGFYELDCAESLQNGQQGQLPIEILPITAPVSGYYGFAIKRYSGSVDPDMEVFFVYKEPVFRVADGSLTVPSDATEVTAVAALDAGGSFPLEPYSSRGPTNGPGGSLSGGFVKPDISGYANVSTASYGPRQPGSPNDFDGTSAACPHVAGAAAVVWSANPGWSNNQVRSFLQNNAVEMGPTGKDNDYGYGRLHLGNPPVSCTYSISPTSANYGASGGNGSFSVYTQAGCTWNASSNHGWISITGGASGTGNGTVSYSVASNGSSSPRTGTISAAGRTFTITQSGTTSCDYSISPTSQSFGASGGNGTVSVSTTAGCTWTASSNNSWIHVTSGSSGTGSGTVNYSVDANAGGSRTGTMTIAGRTFTISQSGGGGGDSYVYQAAGIAHAGGAGGSVWRSTLCVTNRSGSTTNLTLVYRMASNTVTRTHTLQNGRIKEWEDVAVSLFNQSNNTSGSIEILSNVPVIVVARTYNEGASGTFGQGMPGNDDSATLTSGQTGVLPQIKKTSSFRTNIGFMNHGSSACSVRVKLFRDNGSQIGNTINTSVPASKWKQINDVFDEAGVNQCAIGYATVQVMTQGGKVWAYASVVDNGTGDPTTIPLFIE